MGEDWAILDCLSNRTSFKWPSVPPNDLGCRSGPENHCNFIEKKASIGDV